jgi:predicted dehydrogenase
MQKKYRAALIGLGNIAWRFDKESGGKDGLSHATAYSKHLRTEIVGGCSRDKSDRQAFEKAFHVPTYSTADKMIEDTNPDIVSICSPTSLHFEHGLLCLQAGIRMIWLEKPATESLAEHQALIQEMKTEGKKSTILINYQRRYMESYEKLASLYRNKALGECRLIQLNYSRGLETNGSHMLDLLFFIVGEGKPYQLESVMNLAGHENPSFILSIKEGPGVIVSGIDLPYHCIDISLVFQKGRASIIHGGMTPILEKMVEHEMFPGFFRLQADDHTILGQGGFTGSMQNALNDLIYSYEHNLKPRSNPETALAAQSLIHEIREKDQAPPT